MKTPATIFTTTISIFCAVFVSLGFFHIPIAHAGTINVPTNFLTLNTGLVGWWTMDGKDTTWTSSTTGTTADKSGNGNTGTLTNMKQATSPVVGKVGQALGFNGTSQYVNVGLGSIAQITTDISICAWVKTTSTSTQDIIGGRGTDTNSGYQFDLFYSSGTRAGFQFWGGFIAIASAGYSLSDGNWHLYCVTSLSSTTNAIFYRDGSFYNNYASPSTGAVDSTAYFAVGALNNKGTIQGYLSGTIDDVRIYNRALSAGEVGQLYNMGTASHVNTSQVGPANINSGLVGWWTMDGKDTTWTSSTAGTTADKSGNGNTGTLTSMNQATSPVVGKVGQALKFNGTSQYVNVTGISVGSSHSISIWFKTSSVQQYLFDSATGRVVVGWNLANNLGYYNGVWHYNTVGTFSDGKWHNIIVTDNVGTVNIYIDSTLDYSGTGGSASIGGTSAIGSYYNGSNLLFNGSEDDVRIYNRALSAGEVQQLYNMGR